MKNNLAEQKSSYSFEDLDKIEKETGEKFELINGQLVMMAGTEADHGILIHSVTKLLDSSLKSKRCKAIPDTLEIEIINDNRTDKYKPDVMVICPPFDLSKTVIDNPKIVVEVLSKSSVIIDQNEKRDGYMEIKGLKGYLVINKWKKEVILFSPTGDGYCTNIYRSGDVVELKDWFSIEVDEIYLDLEQFKDIF